MLRLLPVTALVLLAFAAPALGAVPGKNGKIAFVSNRTGHFDIYTMNADGGDVTALTNDPAIDLLPAWSPDGKRIAFLSSRGGGYGGNIWVMNADGTGLSKLTTIGGLGKLSWSPDGSRIAFERYPGIWTVNADGTNLTQLNSQQCDAALHCTTFGYPAWNPNGKTIAFTGTESDDQGRVVQQDIWQLTLGGGSESNITMTPDRSEQKPDWSPNSARIAFSSFVPFGSEQVWTMSPSGLDRLQLTSTGSNDEPAWSPDGTRIAFTTFRDGNAEIYTMNADGGDQTNLTRNSASDYEPSWQPIPNQPPDCSHVTASPDTFWPPNHKLVPVSLAGATDPDGDQVTLTITGVTQDEQTGGSASAVLGPATNDVSLRAERDGAGDGRVYRIAFKATDGRGGECSGTATVGVPHKKNGTAVDSAPPSYDSLGGTP